MSDFISSGGDRQVRITFEGSGMVPLEDFLNHLFGGTGGFFELTYIEPPGVSINGPHIVNESYQLGHEKPNWDHVREMNRRGYGVYYSLTIKKRRPPENRRSNENATAWLSCLWIEIDLKDGIFTTKELAYQAITNLKHPATVIIDSGGGLHALWRITPIQVTSDNTPIIKEILRGMAKAVQGDSSVAELARVFRLPGTINTKPERNGAVCQIIDWLPGELTLEDFSGYRVLVQPIVAQVDRQFSRPKPEETPGYINWYLDQAHPDGDRNNSLNWTAYKMHSDGYSEQEAIHILLNRALLDGLSEKESLRTIHSAFTGKAGTPSYISKAAQLRMRAGDAVRRLGGAG